MSWTDNEDKMLVKAIQDDVKPSQFAVANNKKEEDVINRLQRIIYNAMHNNSRYQSIDEIAKLLKLPNETVQEYYNSYKEKKEPKLSSNNLSFSAKIAKLKIENEVMEVIIKNRALTNKLDQLINDGKVDKSIKEILRQIREN
jgi:hypothetical protein